MRFQRIIEAVNTQPWFITASGYASVRDLLKNASARNAKMDDEIFAQMVRERPAMTIDGNGIASICIYGVLGLHLSGIEKSCGNTDYKDIEKEIGEAIGQGARGILLFVDSPGGMATGCEECADFIARAPVPKVSFVDSIATSAAFYLMAGGDAIVSTASAHSGSIGVIIPWVDESKMWELDGLSYQPITNPGADLKGTASGPSLTDAQRQYLMEGAERTAARFQQHVKDYRVVDDEVFRAGHYDGEEAMRLGLVDYIGNASTAYGTLLSKIDL